MVRLIIKQPIKGWFSSAFSQSPTIPPTEDRGLWQRDWGDIRKNLYNTWRYQAILGNIRQYWAILGDIR